ncbi:MAG: hypothetical protein ABIJ09_03020 [Pseudomonadota bacterium]
MRVLLPLAVALGLCACPGPMPNTAAAPGDLSRFDPVASYAAMARFAGPEAQLIAMDARFVRSDGTLDLGADYLPTILLRFVTRASAEDVAAQGARAPGSGFKVGDRIETAVSVITPRLISASSSTGKHNTWRHLGMERTPQVLSAPAVTTAPPPACSLGAL